MRPLAARNGKTIARVPASFAEAISFIFRALFNSLLGVFRRATSGCPTLAALYSGKDVSSLSEGTSND